MPSRKPMLLRLTTPIAPFALAIGALSAPAAGRAAVAKAPPAPAAIAAPAKMPSAAPAKLEVATFAMGCFWCAETDFEGRSGIRSVVSGYTGGHREHPAYEEVGSGFTGHAESIQITYDPAKIGYAQLLDIFWHSVDPTQANGQFCDHGNQYRSAIFYRDEAQQRLALESKAKIEGAHVLKSAIVTQIVKATTFWPAEEYHQDFWKKDPQRYFSYREGCGRDRRLAQIWGAAAARPSAY